MAGTLAPPLPMPVMMRPIIALPKLSARPVTSMDRLTTSIETEDVGFFTQHNLPELSVKRVTEVQIRRLFDYLANPDWPTEFD